MRTRQTTPIRNIQLRLVSAIIPPPVGEAGFSSARLCTSVRVYVTTLQRCGGIRAVQALLFFKAD